MKNVCGCFKHTTPPTPMNTTTTTHAERDPEKQIVVQTHKQTRNIKKKITMQGALTCLWICCLIIHPHLTQADQPIKNK